jgi:transposase
MPAPYSKDLRTKVLNSYVLKKESLMEIANNFQISIKTIRRWITLKKETGSIDPKKEYQKGHSHAIKDLEKFKNTIENTAFSTVQEIVDFFKIGTVHSIGRTLKKIKYVKKKV